MNLLRVNLEKTMVAANRKVLAKDAAVMRHAQRMSTELLKLVSEAKDERDRMDAAKWLGLDYRVPLSETFVAKHSKWMHLPEDRIFDIKAIKSVCQKYGLRFLPSTQYRGALDSGITPAIEALAKLNNGLPGVDSRGESTGNVSHRNYAEFMIAAPAEAFELKDRPAPDPLLFIRLDGELYYLVHKWGNDLTIFRRLRRIFGGHLPWLFPLIGVPLMFATGFCRSWFTPAATEPWIGTVLLFGAILAVLGAVISYGPKPLALEDEGVWNDAYKPSR